jgi:hypothetical protein
MPGKQAQFYGRHFDAQRTKDSRGDVGLLSGNVVNLTMPSGSTDRDSLMEFSRSAHRPFRAKFLNEKLKDIPYIRGRVFSGSLANAIETVLLNYPLLRWWLEEDGLVVDEARSELGSISEFDRVAGALVVKHSEDGKLSAQALELIAKTLDQGGIKLKENLQPKQWKGISDYNQKYSKAPIRTFAAAVGRPQFSRSVRRRLYVARDHYKNALRHAKPILVEI